MRKCSFMTNLTFQRVIADNVVRSVHKKKHKLLKIGIQFIRKVWFRRGVKLFF